MQDTGSFKLRGAMNRLLSPQQTGTPESAER